MTRVLGLRTENVGTDGEVMEDGLGDEDGLQLAGIVTNDDELSQSIKTLETLEPLRWIRSALSSADKYLHSQRFPVRSRLIWT
jgi:hypothetical protein